MIRNPFARRPTNRNLAPVAPARATLLQRLERRVLLNAVPDVSVDVADDALIGEAVEFEITFDLDDAATGPGFGPFIDVVLPRNGADGAAGTDTPDGIGTADPVSFDFFGSALTPVLDVTVDPSGTVEHPLLRNPDGSPTLVTGLTPGDRFIVLQLPLGSYEPTTIPLTVSGSANLSDLADVGVALPIQVRGGFQFGCDAEDNPSIDDPNATVSPFASDSVTPGVVLINKVVNADEQETATGRNYPKSYTITLDIADGQTVTDVEISDPISDRIVYLGNVALGGASPDSGTGVVRPPEPLIDSGAQVGDELIVDYATVLATGSASDLAVSFDFYVPESDSAGNPIIDPMTGAPTNTQNSAKATYDWDPIDDRDAPIVDAMVEDPLSGEDQQLTNRSIAIQKSVIVAVDSNPGAADPAPGDVLEYRVQFQISDYFDFNNLIVNDLLSDGQSFDASFVPKLVLLGNAGNPSALSDFDTGNFGSSVQAGAPYGTEIVFRISDELQTRMLPGTVTGNEGFAPGTTGEIIYRAVIDDTFRNPTIPAGAEFVDEGDVLNNQVEIQGTVVKPDGSEGGTPTDGSGSTISIPRGNVDKEVYAIEGDTTLGSLLAGPGDLVTYRIQYELPQTRFDTLFIKDSLPLPIFDASTVTTGIFDSFLTGTAVPGVGEITYGPDSAEFFDLYFSGAGLEPTLSQGPGNSFLVSFDPFAASIPQPTTIDLLFTVEFQDFPFDDGLFLSNLIVSSQGTTNSGVLIDGDIAQIISETPKLNLNKGVVSTNTSEPPAIFDPIPVGPVTFADPGISGDAFNQVITSDALALSPIDSDLDNVDAGDLVKFAIVIENTGNGEGFDLVVTDTLPPGFVIPTAGPGPAAGPGLNLQVTLGDGTPLQFTDVDENVIATGTEGHFFFITGTDGRGIRVVDPADLVGGDADDGAIDGATAGSITGTNLIVVTFDLQVADNAIAGSAQEDVGELARYGAINNGRNWTTDVDGDFTDNAIVTITEPVVSKTLVNTEIVSATNATNEAVIGEFAVYDIVVRIPEGVTLNAVLTDIFDAQANMAFVELIDVTASDALSTTLAGGFGAVTPIEPGASDGLEVSFDLGTITNTDQDNSVDESVTLRVKSVILNDVANQSRAQAVNAAVLDFEIDATGTPAKSNLANSDPVFIIEPDVDVTKTATVNAGNASSTTGDAGDPVTYTITIEHSGQSDTDAFEVELMDQLPPEIIMTSIVGVTDTLIGGLETNDFALVGGDGGVLQFALGGDLSQNKVDLEFGRVITVTLAGNLDLAVVPGQQIPNTANVQWTSLDGDPGVRSPYNVNATERTGVDGPNGALNDYADSGTAIITVTPTGLEKSIVATSEDHTVGVNGNEQLAIGEIVRYRLVTRIPESTLDASFLQDQLPNRLTYLNDGTTKVAFVGNDFQAFNSTAFDPTVFQTQIFVNGDASTVDNVVPTYVIDPDLISAGSTNPANQTFAPGVDPYFSFETITNGENDQNGEFVVLEFNALVNNINRNQAGGTVPNQYNVLFENQSQIVSSNRVISTIVEPDVSVEKQITTTPVDAGDIVRYQITISNSNDSTTTTAFDLRLVDSVDRSLELLSIDIPSGSGITNNSNIANNRVDLAIDRLEKNESVVIEVEARVTALAEAGLIIPNTANITYTSLAGPQGTANNPTGSSLANLPSSDPGEINGERTGEGAPNINSRNNYFDSDTVEVTLDTPDVVKSVFPATYTIGEIVDYEILVTLSEGTTRLLDVVDDLPVGLEYVSYQVVTDPQTPGGESLIQPFNGNLPTPTSNIPSVSGDDLVLTFGDVVTAADNNPDNNAFVVLVQARVLNELSNQNGDTLTNTGQAHYLDVNNEIFDIVVGSVDITLIEPELNVDKQITSAPAGTNPDAGDVVEYTVIIDHQSTSTSDAFEVMFRDMAPPNTLITRVVSVTGTGLAAEPVPIAEIAPDGSAIVLSDVAGSGEFDLPLNATITLVYEVTLQDSITPGEVIVNEAMIDWSSLDGDVNSGDLRGERDASGRPDTTSVNDYFDNASATITAGGFLTLDKSVIGPTQYAIGDTVVYELEVGLFEGTTPNILVIDDIPDVMTVDESRVMIIAGSNITFDPNTPVIDFDGDMLRIQLGDVLNASDNDPTNDKFVIRYEALIVNDPLNSNGQTKENVAQVTADGQLTATDQQQITIVEPFLAIDKSISDETPHLGDTVTYQFQITHTQESTTDAYDLIITDMLPPEVTVDTMTISVDAPAGTVVTDNSSGNTIDIRLDELALNTTVTVTFDAQVTTDITDYGTMFTNTATLDWDNQPGLNPEQRLDSDQDTARATIIGPDLQIEKTTNAAVLMAGDLFSYEIIVTNKTGPFQDTATGVTVVDRLPEGLSFVESVSPFFLVSDPTAGTVTWVIDTLDPGDSVLLDLTVQLSDPAPAVEEIRNEVEVTHDDIDPTPLDNIDDEKTPIDEILRPDLTITKDDGRIQVFPGDVITYEIVVTNVGRQDARGVEVTDMFPNDILDFVSASDGGVYDPATGIVNWQFPVLGGNGDQITLTLTGHVKTTVLNPTITEFTNFVSVKDDGELGPDPTPENNQDSDTDKILFYGTDAFNDFLDHPDRELPRLRPVSPVTEPILSGTADPGTTLYLEYRDQSGQVIGWRSVVADTGGNYIALFQGVEVDQGVHRSSAEQSFAAQNRSDSAGYNLRRYYEPAQQASSYFSEVRTVDTAFRNRAGQVLHSMQAADERPLRLSDLDSLSSYESLVTSPLSSGQ